MPHNHSDRTAKVFREKILHMYDNLFSELDVEKDGHFWDDFFLLKPKTRYLSDLLTHLDVNLPEKKSVLRKLVSKSVHCLSLFQTDRSSRAAFNALVTLSVLLEELTKKETSRLIGDLFISANTADQNVPVKVLFESLHFIISESDDTQLLKECFRFLMRLTTVTDDIIMENPFLPYFMVYSFFDDFMRMIADPLKRSNVGQEVVALLGILPHFGPMEPEANPYMQLSVLDPSIEMMGIAAVIGDSFRSSSKLFFQKVIALQRDNSWMSWLTKPMTRVQPPTFDADHRDSMLLALFTGLQIGRNFVHAFTHAQSEILIGPQPSPSPVEKDSSSFTQEPSVVTPRNDSIDEPSNLFVEFLQYASIVLQFIKDRKPSAHAKMSLIILCTVTEDHYTTQSLHDFSINYRVHFYRAASRYHPSQILCSSKPEPLACAVLNLISEFITSHMMPKNFPDDLYFRCLLIVYRLMDYQKRTRFRLPYQWKTLWTSLLTLLKFLENNEATLSQHMSNFFLLCTQVVNILNIFLIGGDAILSQVGSYDDLCYEIVRNSCCVNNIYAMGLRFSASQNATLQASAKKFLSSLINIRSVMTHFTTQIDAFSAKTRKVTMEREEIIGVIQKNYDTLSLKLVDMTDCFEKNAISGKDKEFIQSFLKEVVLDLRQMYVVSDCLESYIVKINET